MKKRILVLTMTTLFVLFAGIYYETIQRGTLELPANILHSIGLSEGELISDVFDDLDIRKHTIDLYEKSLSHIHDDVHKAKVMTNLAIEYRLYELKYIDHAGKADENFNKALTLLNNKIDLESGYRELYLARAKVLKHLGALEESKNNLKSAEDRFHSAIADYHKIYQNIEMADEQLQREYAELYYNLAMNMRTQQHYGQAIKHFDKSLMIYRQLEPSSDGQEAAVAFLNIIKHIETLGLITL